MSLTQEERKAAIVAARKWPIGTSGSLWSSRIETGLTAAEILRELTLFPDFA